MQTEFAKSIQQWVKKHGAPQLIVLTGDLTYSGQVAEFVELDLFLEALLKQLKKSHPKAMTPLIIPVPGNHDIKRPQGTEVFGFLVLDKYSNNKDSYAELFKKTLWQQQNSQLLKPLFKNYQSWLEKSILPPLQNHPEVMLRTSFFPGDLFLDIHLYDHLPLCVVALNTTWMQYKEGDFRGKLELASEQLHALLVHNKNHDEDSWVARLLEEQPALLLMHHPLDWFSVSSRETFGAAIYTPNRFSLCLHGHLHRGRSEQISVSGGKPRYYFQAPSLFGMEHYGHTKKEQRSIGYAWGRLSAKEQVQIWLLKRTESGGEQVFRWYDHFVGEETTGLWLRTATANDGFAQQANILIVDMKPWLIHLLDQTEYLKIGGIGSGAGRTKTASRYPIQQLFTPLRSRGEFQQLPQSKGEGQIIFPWAELDNRVELTSLLPTHHRLLIEGQPGAGKTTFLRLLAAMLTKDCLNMDPPTGTSWRSLYLGMDDQKPARIPLLLHLAKVAMALPNIDTSKNNHLVLLEVLSDFTAEENRQAWQNHCQQLLENGEAVLLLDGLDEVADPDMRERLFAIFDNAQKEWSQSQIIVTSRPFGLAALRERGFYHTTVESFGDIETREFIERWVNTLYDLHPGESASGEGERYRNLLQQAIVDKSSVRQLATNPVMLTCLCVVHWNEGQLPDGRARVYQAVIRWLISARTKQRKNHGYSNRFALEAFAALAIVMMGEQTGEKRSLIALEEAAQAVTKEIQRQFPKLSRKRDQLKEARAWLRFECLGSGMIEERHGGEIRFWHLTFQEYMAAQDLAWRGDCLDATENCWWPVIEKRLDDIQWRETVDLFPGVLFDEGGKGRVDFLLEQVLKVRGELRPENESLATDAWIAGVMGRILPPLQEVYGYNPPPEVEKRFRSVQKMAMAIFTLKGAALVPAKQRVAAAEALGQGGDPRLLTEHWIDLPGHNGVSLAKYPVTVQEFQLFIDYGGYQEPDYWDKEGWEKRQKEEWKEPGWWTQQRDTPNHPVYGVSWYEARAYCNWLSQQRKATIRLFTEAEWRTAATPTKGKYPWGAEEPDSERLNEGLILTPVGIYPKGDGPYGHCDLLGNVWEFSETKDGKEIQFFGGKKIEWLDEKTKKGFAGVDNSPTFHPSFRSDLFGFRLARSQKS